MSVRLGLPMWGLPEWQFNFFGSEIPAQDYLRHYASVFATVEGNTTFYAIPSEASVLAWQQSVPSHFRFLLKMPKAITHDSKLQNCDLLLKGFFERIAPLKNQLGPIMIQLPPSFDGRSLSILQQFLRKLPASFSYAVEARHTDFFDGSEYHQALDETLNRLRISRVVFDSRGLFASTDTSAATLDAKAKKPNFPLVACESQKHIIIRFIGDTVMANNDVYLQHWLERIPAWVAQGKDVFFMLHMADNSFAPDLAKMVSQELQAVLPDWNDMALWPIERANNSNGQMRLF